MCFFVDDDDDESGTPSSNSGNAKLQLRNHHTWLIPRKALVIIVTLAIMMVFIAVVMMAIGGGIGSAGLQGAGGVIFGLGIILLIVCLLVCLYAYFFYGTKEQATQTTDTPWSDEYTPDTPAYASIGRPSALKSPDSTLKRNGILGPKKVTMAPELGQYGELPLGSSAGAVHTSNASSMSQGGQATGSMGMGHGVNTSGSMGMGHGVNSSGSMVMGQGDNTAGAMGMGQGVNTSGAMGMGQGVNTSGTMGMGHSSQSSSMNMGHSAHSAHSTAHTTSMASNSPAISGANVYVVEGGGVGTLSRGGGSSIDSGTLPRGGGGIDGSTVGTGGIRITSVDGNQPFPSPGSSISYGGSTSQYHSVTGGGSSASGSLDTYAYPKSVLPGGPGVSSGYDMPGSQFSTLRSIPVTHIVSDGQKQQQQQQYREEAVEYARVNKPAKSVHQTVRMDLPQQGIVTSQGQAQFQRRYREDDFDYDNPVERTPMIPAQNLSYHEQQMQFQRQQQRLQQQQQDLHTPRQVNTFSLQRQTAPNPFNFNQHQHHQQQQHQYQTLYEQQQQQHQRQQQYNVSNSTSTRNSFVDDLPAPQPLVYPSARRPMTFEQVSSSKMSVYDNVLANNLRGDEEEEE